ncbi:hypothetical protein SynBIOSE41_01900 [Synechococcus sp. BIOS-E4-1]|nr:hypothetical protein SynBIOSE41_01900 [Synechococcus sp. BIOS-E4-1]
MNNRYVALGIIWMSEGSVSVSAMTATKTLLQPDIPSI